MRAEIEPPIVDTNLQLETDDVKIINKNVYCDLTEPMSITSTPTSMKRKPSPITVTTLLDNMSMQGKYKKSKSDSDSDDADSKEVKPIKEKKEKEKEKEKPEVVEKEKGLRNSSDWTKVLKTFTSDCISKTTIEKRIERWQMYSYFCVWLVKAMKNETVPHGSYIDAVNFYEKFETQYPKLACASIKGLNRTQYRNVQLKISRLPDLPQMRTPPNP